MIEKDLEKREVPETKEDPIMDYEYRIKNHIGVYIPTRDPAGPIGGGSCHECGARDIKYDADTGVSYCNCGWNNRCDAAENLKHMAKNGEITSDEYRKKYLKILSGMKVNVLGTKYTITVKKYDEDEAFSRRSIDGYCDSFTNQIVVCDISTYKGWEHEPPETIAAAQKETIRHEIVHAFLSESGLDNSALNPDVAWAKNEEMVDWIAIQGPKIYKAWQEAGAV